MHERRDRPVPLADDLDLLAVDAHPRDEAVAVLPALVRVRQERERLGDARVVPGERRQELVGGELATRARP